MQTSDLIARLSDRPAARSRGRGVEAHRPRRDRRAALALGALLIALGTDLSDAIHTSAFWMKWGYGFAVSGIALWLCLRLARPERVSGALLLALAVPVLALTIGSIQELATTSPDARMTHVARQLRARLPVDRRRAVGADLRRACCGRFDVSRRLGRASPGSAPARSPARSLFSTRFTARRRPSPS